MQNTLSDPKLFNDVIDIPPNDLNDLNDLLYRRPENKLIKMMEEAVQYANSKIIPLIDPRQSMYVTSSDTYDDTDSD